MRAPPAAIPVDLWSARGVSHAEIVRRLPERPVEECLAAFAWWKRRGFLPPETFRAMHAKCDEHRSSALVLALVEPIVAKHFLAQVIAPEIRAAAMELHALVIECLCRACEVATPRAGNN